MKNNLAILLGRAKNDGRREGLSAAVVYFHVGIENVMLEHEIEDEERHAFLREFDAEIGRLLNFVYEDIEDGAVEIVFKADEIRERAGLPKLKRVDGFGKMQMNKEGL